LPQKTKMKKIYLLLFVSSLSSMHAQTLSRTSSEPIAGDKGVLKQFDSTTALPKNTGAGQSWNFNSLTPTPSVPVTTNSFVPTSAAGGATAFPGATVLQEVDGGEYIVWKSATTPTTQFEMMGIITGSTAMSYSNTQVKMVWPMSLGTSFSDPYGGSGSDQGYTVSINGTNAATATGTGTITLPSGQVITDILQVLSTDVQVMTITSSITINQTITTKTYDYYTPRTKFPVLSLSYVTTKSFFGNSTEATILVNTSQEVGLAERGQDVNRLYPNPANSAFTIEHSDMGDIATIEILNSEGRLVDRHNSTGNDTTIDSAHLSAGLYLVRITSGNKQRTERLVIEK
jgi:hypothetical protein